MTGQRITYGRTAPRTYRVLAHDGERMVDVGWVAATQADMAHRAGWLAAYREDGQTHEARFHSRAEAGEWLARRVLPES